MSVRRIHMTIKVFDLVESGIATDCGATEEIVTKLRTFIADNMFSNVVGIEIDEIAISDGDDWRIAS